MKKVNKINGVKHISYTAVSRKPRDDIKDIKAMVGSDKRVAKRGFPVTSDHGKRKNAVYGQTAPDES